eukprot:4932351-Pleurochrysis_carterae.AAC.5
MAATSNVNSSKAQKRWTRCGSASQLGDACAAQGGLASWLARRGERSGRAASTAVPCDRVPFPRG